MKILIAYIPVLHAGYEKFLEKHRNADLVLVFGFSAISSFSWLKKDLRCLSPGRVVASIRSWNIFPEVRLLEDVSLNEIKKASLVVMPDETECHIYAEQFLTGVNVVFDSVKLRYDKKRTESTSTADAPEVSSNQVLAMMKLAVSESNKSPDWWLQVGAVIARNGEILLAGYNEHKPTEREAVFEGDPRSNFGRGIGIDLTLADHAERVLIGEAARRDDIGLLGSDLFITVFPCAACAYQIIRTGIRRCFFRDGWVLMLESDKILRQAGVELFHVKV